MKKTYLITLISFAFATIIISGASLKLNDETSNTPSDIYSSENLEIATFAGGCFWCMEKPFEKLPGVEAVISGYTGGKKINPTYYEVSAGTTGHAEAVQIHFDPDQISYKDLLQVFWRQINPTDDGGQFVDRGSQYRSEIFYHDEEQKTLAIVSKAKLAKSGRFDKPIVTPITAFEKFYEAEEYHQDYYIKNPAHYNRYRNGSGRDQFLKKIWGDDRVYKIGEVYDKPNKEQIKAKLTAIQYEVTQNEATERPFNNEYWDNKKAGIYVDIVSGEPLFSSTHKFRSGTGWPSFTQPIDPQYIQGHSDKKLGYERTELRSTYADSHLGHVFPDGPKPTGMRYCINSASLRFIAKEDLDKEGYGKYAYLFEK